MDEKEEEELRKAFNLKVGETFKDDYLAEYIFGYVFDNTELKELMFKVQEKIYDLFWDEVLKDVSADCFKKMFGIEKPIDIENLSTYFNEWIQTEKSKKDDDYKYTELTKSDWNRLFDSFLALQSRD